MASAGRTVPLRVLDTEVDLVCGGERADELAAALAERWALALRDDGPPTRTISLALERDLGGRGQDGTLLGDDLGRLLVAATQAVTYEVIAAQTGRLLMLHAAAVAHPTTGAAVVAVAAGGTGKTTVCRTLGAGRGYVTDETVGVRPDGSIASYAKPLSVRRPGSEVKDEVDPRTWGLAPPPPSPYVAAVLLLDRQRPGGAAPRVTPLDPFDALIDLAPETSALDRLERPLHRLLGLLAHVDLLARVSYAEARDLAPVVADVIGPAEAS